MQQKNFSAPNVGEASASPSSFTKAKKELPRVPPEVALLMLYCLWKIFFITNNIFYLK